MSDFSPAMLGVQLVALRTAQQGYPSDQTPIWKLRVERRKFETQPQLTRETRCSSCYLRMHLALSLALDRGIYEWMNAESDPEACYGTPVESTCVRRMQV